jgi:Extensin-like protein C-terminus
MPNSAVVSVMPPATLRCPIAEAVAQWVRNDLDTVMAELDSPPAAITNHGSYECRAWPIPSTVCQLQLPLCGPAWRRDKLFLAAVPITTGA